MYRHIVEASNEGIWSMDKEYVTTYVNTHMAHMLGYKQEEMIGKNVSHFMFPEELNDHIDKMKIRILGEPQTYERRFRKKDGNEAWMIVSAVPIFEDEGKFAGSFAMFTDITERKKIEKKLKQSEEHFRLVLENVNDGVYVHLLTPSGPGKLIEVNRQACNMLGYTREEFLNMTVADIDVPEQKENIPEIMNNIYKKGYAIFETKHITKDGKKIPVEVNTKIFDMEGKPVILSVVRDITERKKSEEEILRREKKLKDYIDNAPDGIFVKNKWNPWDAWQEV